VEAQVSKDITKMPCKLNRQMEMNFQFNNNITQSAKLEESMEQSKEPEEKSQEGWPAQELKITNLEYKEIMMMK
jgi:hypothetical protein